MIKYVFILLLPSFLNTTTIDKVRDQFPYINSMEECINYEQLLQSETSVNAQAYTAAMVLMKSKFAKSVVKKYTHFKKGKKQLDKILDENPTNIEFRYIRYGFQKNIPSFLGYNDDIDEDFRIFSEGLQNSEFTLSFKKKMITNLMDLENNSDAQRQTLTFLYNSL